MSVRHCVIPPQKSRRKCRAAFETEREKHTNLINSSHLNTFLSVNPHVFLYFEMEALRTMKSSAFMGYTVNRFLPHLSVAHFAKNKK